MFASIPASLASQKGPEFSQRVSLLSVQSNPRAGLASEYACPISSWGSEVLQYYLGKGRIYPPSLGSTNGSNGATQSCTAQRPDPASMGPPVRGPTHTTPFPSPPVPLPCYASHRPSRVSASTLPGQPLGPGDGFARPACVHVLAAPFRKQCKGALPRVCDIQRLAQVHAGFITRLDCAATVLP